MRATVTLPGSKSLTNRALVLAALSDGPSVVRRALRSRDTLLMAQGLTALGAAVDTSGDDWRVTPGRLAGPAAVDCGLAGTVMRFVPPVAALADGPVVFDGDPHARTRPMGEVLDALRGLGVAIDDEAAVRCRSPWRAPAGSAAARSPSTPPPPASSSPRCSWPARATTRGRRTPRRQAGALAPHIEMTVAHLRAHGVEVDDSDANRWRVLPGPVRAVDVDIEPDLSNAAPFLAAALVTGGEVTVRDWPRATTQPATRCARS